MNTRHDLIDAITSIRRRGLEPIVVRHPELPAELDQAIGAVASEGVTVVVNRYVDANVVYLIQGSIAFCDHDGAIHLAHDELVLERTPPILKLTGLGI